MVNKRLFAHTNTGLIMKKLYELASEGVIIIEIRELERLLTGGDAKDQITEVEFAEGMKEAEDKNIIIITKRQIASNPEKEFVSIKLNIVSLESVMWVLKSLEKDEMTPIERSIQSRFKESFGIKMTTQEWEKVMKVINDPKLILRTPTDPRYEFDVIKINDPVSGCEINSIYPKAKRWISYDISLKAYEINRDLFNEFLSFMKSYLCSSQMKQTKENERAIPGGRYGCAQFVKLCGTSHLKSCSLGQLSQFIQYAINEDLLRYKKTLLVWNQNPMKPNGSEIALEDSETVRLKKTRVKHKLSVVKQAIISILTENPLGLSLAQLPLHLKYKLPFPLDLNELGFVKLKELLVTMADRIRIELRGHNHPFAVLVSEENDLKRKVQYRGEYSYTGAEPIPCSVPEQPVFMRPNQLPFPIQGQTPFLDFNKYLELLRNCVYNLLQEFPAGLDSIKLPTLIYTRLGLSLDWSFFGCSSLFEFLLKYVAQHFPLEFLPINPYDDTLFIVRNKETYLNYAAIANYYNQQYSDESYSTPYMLVPHPSYNTSQQAYNNGRIESNYAFPLNNTFTPESYSNSKDSVRILH